MIASARRILADGSGRAAALLTLTVTGVIPWMVWGPKPPYRIPVVNVAHVACDLLAALAIWLASGRPGTPPRAAAAWRWIALAQLAYAAGDGLWAYYESVLRIDPWPSAADVFYLLFYPLMLAGVLMFPRAPQSGLERVKFTLDAGTVLVGGWMVIWYFVLGPTVIEAGDAVTRLWSAAYPSGNIVLLFAAATLVLRETRGASRLAAALLTLGIAVFLAADLVFGYLSLLDRYETGSWPDGLYMLTRLLLAWAAVVDGRVRSRGPEDAPQPADRPRGAYLRLGALALGYGVLVLSSHAAVGPGPAPGPLLYGAMIITALVAAREAVTARENQALVAHLRTLARTDPLTGLLSRGEFLLQAEREFARFRIYRRPLSIVMMDLDDLKAINDRLGHDAGDRALAATGRILAEHLRSGDLVARYGGDEFAALLVDTDAASAEATAARIREQVARTLRLAISTGVAQAQDTLPGLQATLEEADRRMYEAKRARGAPPAPPAAPGAPIPPSARPAVSATGREAPIRSRFP
ncbi:MAG TPA: GGDEF domain-containing protein [bacterium]|nr:GGDEF domain-containing protein [bacterium]